jgi:hypothetical protein
MKRFLDLPLGSAMFFRLVVIAAIHATCLCASADDGPAPEFAPYPPKIDVRHDGVLAESYGYHRQPIQPATIMPPGGSYHYGFPVTTYRWGWFGAEHYYPRVVCHRSYYGDCVRWAYRCGY